MSLLPEDTELDSTQAHFEAPPRPRTSYCNTNYEKILFRAKDLDYQAKDLDIMNDDDTDQSENDIVVKCTPGLLALKNKNTTMVRNLSRPGTVLKPTPNHKHREKTFEYVSYLNPGPKKKPLPSLASITKKLQLRSNEEERMTLNFTEDPVAYFSKHKDGGYPSISVLNV